MSSLEEFKTTDQKLLILFVRSDCEFCSQAQEIVEEISCDLVSIRQFVIFNSRVEGMIEIRAIDEPLEGLPLLVHEEEIPEVPCLFDPILGHKMMGIASIERYFEDTGLI